MLGFLVLLCFALLSGATPSMQDLTKYTVYSYAASCRVGLQDWSCYWCKKFPAAVIPPVRVTTVLESNGVYGTYGYVGYSSKEILVAFRGTSSYNNWLHDIDFWPQDFPGVPGARVHRGFYSAYLAVSQEVHLHVAELQKMYPHLPVTITGHSLGAALSVLCAMDLITNNIVAGSKMTVLNIGLPRVGNKVFASYFDDHVHAHYRVVNQHDIVPHFPPALLHFYHVSTELWFPTNTTYFVKCNGSGEDPNCSASVPVTKFSGYDHTHYLGLDANAGSACCQCGSLTEP